MNLGATTCLLFSGGFLILAIIFASLGEKAALLISGFNTLPKGEQVRYDKLKMSTDTRNSFFVWSLLFALGSILSYIFSTYIALIIFAVWIFLFLKNFHSDPEKAFERYRVK